MASPNKKYVQLTVDDVRDLVQTYRNGAVYCFRPSNMVLDALEELFTLARENGNQTVCLAYAVVRDRRKGLGKPGTAGKEKQG